jgi:hypothetical protein
MCASRNFKFYKYDEIMQVSLCINVHKCIRLKRTTLNKAYTDNNRQNAESYIQQFLLCEKDNSVELILKYMSTYLTLSENFQI